MSSGRSPQHFMTQHQALHHSITSTPHSRFTTFPSNRQCVLYHTHTDLPLTHCSACCDLPPVQAEYTPKGAYTEIGGFKSYVVGPEDAKSVIVMIYDVFGFAPQFLQGSSVPAGLCHYDIEEWRWWIRDGIVLIRMVWFSGCDMLASLGFRIVIPDILLGDYATKEMFSGSEEYVLFSSLARQSPFPTLPTAILHLQLHQVPKSHHRSSSPPFPLHMFAHGSIDRCNRGNKRKAEWWSKFPGSIPTQSAPVAKVINEIRSASTGVKIGIVGACWGYKVAVTSEGSKAVDAIAGIHPT